MEAAKEEVSVGLCLWKQAAGTEATAHNIFFTQKTQKTKHLTMAGITGLEESCSSQRPPITAVQNLQRFFLTD